MAKTKKAHSPAKDPSEAQFEKALSELIHLVDSYLSVCAFELCSFGSNFKDGDRDILQEFSALLYPDLPARQEKFDGGHANDEWFDFVYDSRDAAYEVGLFMGAKLAGATLQQMQQLGRHFHKTMSLQPRHASWKGPEVQR